jgi:hypothetical protein
VQVDFEEEIKVNWKSVDPSNGDPNIDPYEKLIRDIVEDGKLDKKVLV